MSDVPEGAAPLARCDGSFRCPAVTHIEGCYTGDGHPDARAALVASPVAYIRAAHGDPGQFLPREPEESIPSWGARAALVALDRAGYVIVAKTAQGASDV